METLEIFAWYQEIESLFTNHEPLSPTLCHARHVFPILEPNRVEGC